MKPFFTLLIFALTACAVTGPASSIDNFIVPGTPWKAGDASLQAHGGGILKVGPTWYWIGENKTNGSHFYANSCYSSPDLVHWKFVNETLKLQSSGDLRAVQEMLGHASISTTQVYTHLDFQYLAKIYDGAHPRARKKK